MTRIVSDAVHASLEGSSWIRRMFEEGAQLKARHGPENVFDFSLGNPVLEPPAAFHEALREVLGAETPGKHRYIPNAGLPETRAYLAAEMAEETGIPYGPEHIVITTGASGAINVTLKAILNPGDEVVALAPYFVEYDFYAANHGGKLVRAETDAEFQIDLAGLERVVTPRTRAVLINSPNNPTGAVYPQAALAALGDFLRDASKKQGRPILLISDEPYRRIVFDGLAVPWVPPLYEHTVVVTSYSKDRGLAGERVGYVAASPRIEGCAELMEAIVLANRILGFVNAPALVQRVLPMLKGQWADVDYYRRLRDQMLPPLQQMGYEVVKPGGAFYLFPRSPIPDDVAFVRAAQKELLLVVPGSGFGRAGHFRIALCVTPEVIDRALPVFEKVLKQAGG